ncbi:hypothetical protein J32TS6_40430 [Virgibacillus pantothenticus]|uniref:DUF4064 domain-containing protein n=1 Tax=Virgibacillus TaxID=84406 RepID=UPI00067D4E80|nr:MULTISPECIES: DUF4064 domain-containing protein [Virgibacillus]MBS7426706.1 DUF4064 domain-containing protein [Virgibacillus sp. 19R1-5]MBU8566034.1 DUF4064 domain-containing protein [Virgibacillus pantothenticus]MBU8602793.1 DUF4064 domain-containing protein [Virgibacillus pantothenticus]MBU8634354.1 DUF4064 domain-containing protein [Virgibacillus pantothenticus]MBU8644637.1 DUF4064 domain-containing protein [Virgibacillus pantothenticus]
MKRTVEMIFTVIGLLVFLLMSISVGVVAFTDNAKIETMAKKFVQLQEQTSQPGVEEFSEQEFETVIETGTNYLFFVFLINLVLGVLALFFLKGDKKPKAAGILLIVTAIVGTIASLFFGIIGGAAYLIAGIVALVRRPKKMIE